MNDVAKEKLNQATQYLDEYGIDMWLIFSSEGSDPAVSLLTGLKTVGRTFFILTREGKKYAVCTIIDAQESEDSGLFHEVIKYQGDPSKCLYELIDRLSPEKIAINYSIDDNLCDGLTLGRYRYLLNILGEKYSKRLVSSEPMLQRVRSIKSNAEIETIKKAIEITQEIFEEVFSQLRPGITEYQVGEMFIDGMSKRGVTLASTKDLSMPIVMKERIAHRAPGNAVLQEGDFLIMDFGIDYQGYCSDISRTVYFLKEGEADAPERFKEIFAAAHGAITEAFNTVKPGVKGYEVDVSARNYLLSKGMPEITHATGHQIGQFEHDGGTLFAPRWERYGSSPYGIVEKGMVFTLEPTILNDEGDYSVLCEEDILVTENGAEFLSKRQNELILIGKK